MMSTSVPVPVSLDIRHAGEPLPPVPTGTRFHLSLNVSNIERVASFLQLVLGVAPVKQRADYAKFELDSPPLLLSLEQNPPQETGSLNHLGFRFSSTSDLLNAQNRIEAAGIAVQREEGVECCYARQTKFWVHDPDHRLWEFYVLEGDLEHRGGGQTLAQMVGDSTACDIAPAMQRPLLWEHRMGTEFSIPATASDQIRLRGSFNVPVSDAEVKRILRLCFENLKPGGQLELHMLTCEQPLACAIELPGPAAYVKHVPVRTRLTRGLTETGFVDCRLTTFRSGACFQLDGQPLRETRIVAIKPLVHMETDHVGLVYRGPFSEIRDDYGHVWRRGELTDCSARRWDELKKTGFESSFTMIPQTSKFRQCGA